MTKEVLMPIADGFEEIEAVTVIDILRRAGAKVTVAALSGEKVIGAHGITMYADDTIAKATDKLFDLVALAGGAGNANALSGDRQTLEIVKKHYEQGRLVAAICASPIALAAAGVIHGEFTCFGGCEKGINAKYVDQKVVENGNVITSQGAGTAYEFALALTARLFGRVSADTIGKETYFYARNAQ
ncbi:MAG: DJ-1/PfpI family protein [Helicobacteraceae bacterium]|jgi:4-methyl-5(b-hydroxyethyl)-thiazole monophosphate biosynthesis|nr:DJ-1/PfpI family protein [Helicobacteraceae bacterium]